MTRCIAEFFGTFWLVFGGCGGKTAEVSKVPLPVYLEINPVRDRVYVRYSIAVNSKENRVRIRIQPANTQGDRAFEIDQKGAIYAY
ncbi:MAG: hypothetical protein LH660_20515 [Phormidesmis sp. CAN_BIN36]|nr:hypothetical protein [Phormidesmis sp. CAN_BIN36]